MTVRGPLMANVQLKVAVPFTNATVTGLFRLMVKVTAPVGIPPNCPVTTAVYVTIWPTVEGLSDELRAVSVPCIVTV